MEQDTNFESTDCGTNLESKHTNSSGLNQTNHQYDRPASSPSVVNHVKNDEKMAPVLPLAEQESKDHISAVIEVQQMSEEDVDITGIVSSDTKEDAELFLAGPTMNSQIDEVETHVSRLYRNETMNTDVRQQAKQADVAPMTRTRTDEFTPVCHSNQMEVTPMSRSQRSPNQVELASMSRSLAGPDQMELASMSRSQASPDQMELAFISRSEESSDQITLAPRSRSQMTQMEINPMARGHRNLSLQEHSRVSPRHSPHSSRESPSTTHCMHAYLSSSPRSSRDEDAHSRVMMSNQRFEPINVDTADYNDDHDTSYDLPDSSPEMIDFDSRPDGKMYSCRFCNFTTNTYTQLQLHMPRHGGVKALKCALCDYTTNDKSNFRRHRRLHIGTNPVSVLKCEKCDFSTILPRKFREHYSQIHHEQLPYPYQPSSLYRQQSYSTPQYRLGQPDLPSNQTPSSVTSNFSASTALHSLLRGIHSTPVHYGPQNGHQPPQPRQCINQYQGYPVPVQRAARSDQAHNHMASNYLRSIVSSIMNNPPDQPTPIMSSAASSTLSSSNFYLAADPTHQQQQQQQQQQQTPVSRSQLLSSMQQVQGQVKVKVEPQDDQDSPETSRLSSTAPLPLQQQQQQQQSNTHNPMLNRPLPPEVNFQQYHRDYTNNNSFLMQCNEATNSFDVQRPSSADSDQQVRLMDGISVDHSSSVENNVAKTTIKLEMSSVGIQCSIPSSMKSDLHVRGGGSERRLSTSSVERGIQCELMTPIRCINQRSQSIGSESEFTTEQQNFQLPNNRCNHCGITFDDEVLYSIHIGCHSHTDPFVCNVCGKPCGNKYGFYSHIMRGHHY